MGKAARNAQRTQQIARTITRMLDNQGMLPDEDWTKDAQEYLEKLVTGGAKNVCHSLDMGITQPGDTVAFVFAARFGRPGEARMEKEQAIKEQVTGLLSEESQLKAIQIILFTDNLEESVAWEEHYTADKLKELVGKKLRKTPSFKCILNCSPKAGPQILNQVKRYEMIQQPPVDRLINQEMMDEKPQNEETISNEEASPKAKATSKADRALVFSIDLYQLVELYNSVGEELYQNNLRLGLRDEIGVDQAIEQTLEAQPENFWFFNNGVTMLVERPYFPCNNVVGVELGQVTPDKPLPFSVINGAQTITAAARFFYRWKYKEEHQKDPDGVFERAKKNAQVLLRIIYTGDEGKDLVQAISIALNRQKPIRIEDISYTVPVLHTLKQYLDQADPKTDNVFQLIRRGEERIVSGRYLDLVSFSRAHKACRGEPDAARSKGAGDLLAIATNLNGTQDDSRFSNGLFLDDWYDVKDEDVKDLFLRDYNAIWCAHSKAIEYEGIRTGKSAPIAFIGEMANDRRTILNNGKWYCVAALIYLWNRGRTVLLNGERAPNFSRFSCPKNVDMRAIMEHMCILMELCIHNDDKSATISANTLKTAAPYDLLLDVLTGDRKPTEPMCEELSKLTDLVGVELPLTLEREDQELLVLDGVEHSTRNASGAMIQILEYALSHCTLSEEWNKKCTKFIKAVDPKKKPNRDCFRRTKRICVNGREFWVGTAADTENKVKLLNQLLQEVKPDCAIQWIRSPDKEPILNFAPKVPARAAN